VCQEKLWAPHRLPPWRMELANFRAQNLPTFPDKNGFPSGATSKNLVIFGHLQGSSRVCTLHLYPWERVCGSKWPTLVGWSNSKYPEQVLLLGAGHRLAYSCTRICGQLLGGSRVCTLLVYVWGGFAAQTGLQSRGYLLRNTWNTCYY
jgi:hypothetical protein